MELDELRARLDGRSTEELAAILRDHDEDEWRPEVFEVVAAILASRGVSPTGVPAREPEGVDELEHQPLVTVARYFSPAEAHAGRAALEAAGLQAWVIDEALGTIYTVGVGTRVQVRAADESVARTILEAGPAAADELPAEIAEPPCQQCGSRQVRSVSEPIDDTETPRARGGRRQRQWLYECGACGHRWPQEE